jgi:hypothetical protein
MVAYGLAGDVVACPSACGGPGPDRTTRAAGYPMRVARVIARPAVHRLLGSCGEGGELGVSMSAIGCSLVRNAAIPRIGI